MIGERIGPWIIEKLLGRGGMGEVYRAREVANASSHVAVKLLHPSLSRQHAERFDREVEALRRLQHEHIVHLLDAGQHNGRAWYAMEYVDGFSLAEVLEQSGSLPHEEVLKIALQICKALSHAHQQEMVHRDLKPSNLLLSRSGVVKLADFGVAKLFGLTPLSATDAVIGTADYVSPEQAAGKPVTKRSDLYSLGVVLYQLLTSRLPFQAETAAEMLKAHQYASFKPPSHYIEGLPHEWDDLISQLLAKDPEKRPASAGMVADTLLRLQRKLARKRPYTVDAIRTPPTRIEGGAADEQRRALGRLEDSVSDAPSPTPWGRLLLFGGALVALLVLLVWGLRPASPETLAQRVEDSLSGGDWISAESHLRRLRSRLGEDPDASWRERLATLEQRLRSGQQLARLKRDLGGLTLTVPSCEAERLFRRGLIAFLQGHTEQAKAIWEQLVSSYRGVTEQSAWVTMAENALKEVSKQPDAAAAFRAALAAAQKEPPAQALQRLRSLRELYANDALLRDELAQLDRLVKELEAKRAP